jgi:hypothetical protein
MKKKEQEQDSLFSHVTYWEELRACKKCSSIHPLSHYKHIDNRGKKGYSLRGKCRLCKKIECDQRYERKLAANLFPDKRECIVCKEEKHRNEFNVDKHGKSGLYSRCKLCDAKKHYFCDYSQSNPTQEDFQRYSKATYCECCEQPFDNVRSGKRKKCQDHDHDSNVLRGIICSECNLAEGMLKHGSKNINFSDHIRHSVLKYMEKWGVTPKIPHDSHGLFRDPVL